LRRCRFSISLFSTCPTMKSPHEKDHDSPPSPPSSLTLLRALCRICGYGALEVIPSDVDIFRPITALRHPRPVDPLRLPDPPLIREFRATIDRLGLTVVRSSPVGLSLAIPRMAEGTILPLCSGHDLLLFFGDSSILRLYPCSIPARSSIRCLPLGLGSD